MSKSYPITLPGQWHQAWQDFECDECHRVIRRREYWFAIETRVSFMRGDDEVACYCEQCGKEKHGAGPTPPERNTENKRKELERLTSLLSKPDLSAHKRRQYEQLISRIESNLRGAKAQ